MLIRETPSVRLDVRWRDICCNGWCVGRHRVRRLMTQDGLTPIYQHPKTSEPHPRHKIHPLSSSATASRS